MGLIPKQFLQGSFFTAMSALLTGIFSYLSRRFMANDLPSDEYAFFYSTMALLSISLLVIHLGTSDVILYELPGMLAAGKKRRAGSTYFYVCRFQTILSFIFFGIFLAGTPLFKKYYFDYEINVGYLWLFFLMLWGFALENTTLFALNSQKKFITVCVLRLVKAGLFLLAILLSFYTHQPLLWIIASLVLITTGCTVVAGWRVTKDGVLGRKVVVPHSIRKSVLRGGITFMLLSGGYALMQDIGTFFLTIFSCTQEVVLFNIALPIAMIVTSFSVVVSVFTPMFADAYQKSEKKRIKKIFNLLFILTAAAMICAMPVLYWGGDWIISLLFSQKFIAAHTCTFFLVEAAILSMPVRVFLSFFNVVGCRRISVKTLIPTAVIALVAYPLLSGHYGATGAGIATFLTTLMWLVANIICYYRFMANWESNYESRYS